MGILRSRIGLESPVDMLPSGEDVYRLFQLQHRDWHVIIVDEC
jgi:thymidine kinase